MSSSDSHSLVNADRLDDEPRCSLTEKNDTKISAGCPEEEEVLASSASYSDESDCSFESEESGANTSLCQLNQQFDKDYPVPAAIKLESQPTSISLHPTENILAAGTIDGDLQLWRYSLENTNEDIVKSNAYSKTVRGVEFSPDGKILFSISKDRSWKLVDSEALKSIVHIKKAHKSALYSLSYIDDTLVATGDGDGVVNIWDHRVPSQKPVQSYRQSEDYISDLAIEPERKKILLATSAEGTLTAFDIRRKKMVVQSEQFKEEFLSVTLIRDKKIVCGGSHGALEIFNWGEFGYIVNAMKSVCKTSIDCLATLNESIVVYGCGDGRVRAASLFPNKLLGVIGQHTKFPVISIALEKEGQFVASVSDDNYVRFWNTRGLDTKIGVKSSRNQDFNLALNTKQNNFFSGLLE